MKKIVIGGQMDKKEIAALAQKLTEGKASVEVMGDVQAAMAIKNGEADIYLGACNTGGGGALALAIALIGKNKCCTVAMPGKIMGEEEIKAEIEKGKCAFGFTAQSYEQVVPTILKYMV
jgi:hypothetical protein